MVSIFAYKAYSSRSHASVEGIFPIITAHVNLDYSPCLKTPTLPLYKQLHDDLSVRKLFVHIVLGDIFQILSYSFKEDNHSYQLSKMICEDRKKEKTTLRGGFGCYHNMML